MGRPGRPHAGLDGEGLAALRAHIAAWRPHIRSRTTFAQSSERRVRRWLDSPAIICGSNYGPLITRALRDLGGLTPILPLDTSVLYEEFCLICVSVLLRGRAVSPLGVNSAAGDATPLVSRGLE